MHIDEFRIEALQALIPVGTQWGFMSDANGDYEITYHNPSADDPTNAEIEAKLAELFTEYDAQAYARARKEKYNALNQLELISDDAINGTTTHKDAIVAIKNAHPKPE
tara:strand:- start:4 stop:327 length:324 start_codon:yes stop_codon:yes gene_type:complete